MATTTRAPPALWLAAILSLLLSLLVRPLERLFYHADLCAAYHASATAAVYLTACLNAAIAAKPRLRRRLRAVRDDADLFARLGPCNRLLVRAYLRGCFLLPNLIGPVWVCRVARPDSRLLDDLAHLYGFAVALLHAPLLAGLAVRLVVPLACRALRRALEAVSRLVWRASAALGDDPAAAAQTALAALHARLGRLPGRVVDAVDGRLLRTELAFLRLAAAFLAAVCLSTFYAMVVDLYRPYLQRLAVRATAWALMSVGDAVFGVGMRVESIVVERGYWEDRSLWEVAGVARGLAGNS
ncbi:hypothetical protein CGRA01v4_08388 [Colletotrichum graminicola]|uniref:Integral membrane protein n=1 Tax=Colletotrichum graminicola (strain M1.001 / M2 / FGSC 10212) TaxID=645133 RepID=E3QMC6_COLGM|nr:uncharacterized protein GLRG_07158 [Colletotrichum graminicola M1.001]EFQ32014.1 hypothetical protein GLRG_07158 [Colletotrichum graminicola M1.001]WDK17105.1 hypothetical protein CGRA01v4_08388 [Colletotrichum graminicola]